MDFVVNSAAGLAKPVLNRYIQEFGSVSKFHISTEGGTKELLVTILLKGEPQPVELVFHSVRLVQREKGRRIRVESLTCATPSKAWIVPMVEKLKILPGEFEISEELADKLSFVLPVEASPESVKHP